MSLNVLKDVQTAAHMSIMGGRPSHWKSDGKMASKNRFVLSATEATEGKSNKRKYIFFSREKKTMVNG